jgi:hypothetical protein
MRHLWGKLLGFHRLDKAYDSESSVDEQRFRKLLSRNIASRWVSGCQCGVLRFLIMYLLSTIQWVEHTDRVINNANEASS